MNDFTKEELIHLFGWAVSLADLLPNTFCESDVNLYNKLHSMIDNYCWNEECQHESDTINSCGIISICEGDIYRPFKCKKCGEYFNDN